MEKCEYCSSEFQEWKIEIDNNDYEVEICPKCGAPSTFDSNQYAKELEWEAMYITGKNV